MLGGRAIAKKCFPLTYGEITSDGLEFDLLKAMRNGLIPSHYLEENETKQLLNGYILKYLDLEIKQQGLVRKTASFTRFMDSLRYSNAELVNYTSIAKDYSVSAVTVKEYYQILCDTLIGTYLYPLQGANKRTSIYATPKFYLFDIGIANSISKTYIADLKSTDAGKSFEHFIYLELLAYNSYRDKFVDINFWRTKHGVEVDFIISEYKKIKVAIECKLTSNIRERDLKGINAFAEEHDAEKLIIVCQESSFLSMKTKSNKEVLIMPWQELLTDLWNDKIF